MAGNNFKPFVIPLTIKSLSRSVSRSFVYTGMLSWLVGVLEVGAVGCSCCGWPWVQLGTKQTCWKWQFGQRHPVNELNWRQIGVVGEVCGWRLKRGGNLCAMGEVVLKKVYPCSKLWNKGIMYAQARRKGKRQQTKRTVSLWVVLPYLLRCVPPDRVWWFLATLPSIGILSGFQTTSGTPIPNMGQVPLSEYFAVFVRTWLSDCEIRLTRQTFKYENTFNNAMFKWFSTIFSLGAPD